jgi:hypothetical protein
VPPGLYARERALREEAAEHLVEPLPGNLAAWTAYELVSDCRCRAGLDGVAVGLAWGEVERVLCLHGPELGIELWTPEIHLKLRRIEALRGSLEADLRADRSNRG